MGQSTIPRALGAIFSEKLGLRVALIVGFVVEVGQGHDGSPFTWLGAVGGVAYLVALVVLRTRT